VGRVALETGAGSSYFVSDEAENRLTAVEVTATEVTGSNVVCIINSEAAGGPAETVQAVRCHPGPEVVAGSWRDADVRRGLHRVNDLPADLNTLDTLDTLDIGEAQGCAALSSTGHKSGAAKAHRAGYTFG
jgi:hypothetical protein